MIESSNLAQRRSGLREPYLDILFASNIDCDVNDGVFENRPIFMENLRKSIFRFHTQTKIQSFGVQEHSAK